MVMFVEYALTKYGYLKNRGHISCVFNPLVRYVKSESFMMIPTGTWECE